MQIRLAGRKAELFLRSLKELRVAQSRFDCCAHCFTMATSSALGKGPINGVNAPVFWSIAYPPMVRDPGAYRNFPEGSILIRCAWVVVIGEPDTGVTPPVVESNLNAEILAGPPLLYPPELLTYRKRSCGSVIARYGALPAATLACVSVRVPSPLSL